jgi:hypothetical protein
VIEYGVLVGILRCIDIFLEIPGGGDNQKVVIFRIDKNVLLASY